MIYNNLLGFSNLPKFISNRYNVSLLYYRCFAFATKTQFIIGTSLALLITEKERKIMSLVPILYTSLILFSILMIVIISISYIAYKVRNRNNEEEQEPVTNSTDLRANSSYIPERRSYQPQAIKVVPAIKNPELKKTYLPNNTTERTTIVNDRDSSERYKRETTKSDYLSSTREPLSDTRSRRTNPGSYRSRLEILNRVAPEESQKEKFTVSGSGSVALPKYYENFRAIQYYSDDEDEYLYNPSRQYH